MENRFTEEEIKELKDYFLPLVDKEYIVNPNNVLVAFKKKAKSLIITPGSASSNNTIDGTAGQVIVSVGTQVNWLQIGDEVLVNPLFISQGIPVDIVELDEKYKFYSIDNYQGVSYIRKRG